MGESNLDENPAILELGIVADMYNNTDKETANKTPNVLQRVQRRKKLHWGIRQGGNSDKKKKQQEMKKVPNPKLSWFEENVIKKIIEEREKNGENSGWETCRWPKKNL